MQSENVDYSKLSIEEIKKLDPATISRVWGKLADDLDFVKARESALRKVVLDGAFGYTEGLFFSGTKNRELPDGSSLKCVFQTTQEFAQGEALEQAIQAAEKLPGGAAWVEANIEYTAKLSKTNLKSAPDEIRKLFEPLYRDKACQAKLTYQPAKGL